VVRSFVERQRRRALAAAPLNISPKISTEETATDSPSSVQILSFSSINCHQCKRLQAPALERVLEARPEAVTIIKVDATTERDLVQTYRVMTVPSTVVLDPSGNAHAINYGFTNTDRLLTQVDEALAKVSLA
jgi:thiol-disulfide isomerase/thioredoxin